MTRQNYEWIGEKMTKHLKNMLLVIVAVTITAIGASFTVKANVGVGAYEALNMSINQLSRHQNRNAGDHIEYHIV